MSFLQKEIQPINNSTAVYTPTVEFVTPRFKQTFSDQISPTRSPWDNYQKRKEIVEEHRAPFIAIMQGMQQDGYIRTAVSKYVNSIFLRGYKLVTLKPEIEKYTYLRLQMLVDAMPDHDHIDAFFHDVARDLVAYANVYMIKIRRRPSYIPKNIKIQGVPRIKPKGKADAKPILEQQDPVAAYELIHPATMHIIRDPNGNVVRYEQWPLYHKDRPQDPKLRREWDADQVIHITDAKEDGFAYGHPFFAPALDDVRMLRNIEDHVSRLAFRFAFPFTQVKVGLPEPGMQAGEEDLSYYKSMIQNAPPDATLVTSEIVEFNVVGAEGEAINLEPYLEHFESRSFSAMGVSGVSMGKGDTSNRSTADAMSVEMHDTIKHYQNVLSRTIGQEIFREILQEGGYELYENFDKNWIWLKFEEIEVENQIRVETHIISKLQANVITISEARLEMGKQPFTQAQWDDSYLLKVLIPQDIVNVTGTTEIDEHGKIMLDKHKADMQTSKQEKDLHPKNLAQADVDLEASKIKGIAGAKLDNKLKQKELDTPVDPPAATASGAGAHLTTSVKTGPAGRTVTVKKPVTAPKGHFAPVPGAVPGPAPAAKTTVKATNNLQHPANQHGARTAPKRKSEKVPYKTQYVEMTFKGIDKEVNKTEFLSHLSSLYSDLKLGAIEQGKQSRLNKTELVPETWLFTLVKSSMLHGCDRYLQRSFLSGVNGLYLDANMEIMPIISNSERNVLTEFNEKTINRLIKDVSRPSLKIIAGNSTDKEMEAKIIEVFNNCEYRLGLIANSELPQAYWLGYATAALEHNLPLNIVKEEDTCEKCLALPNTFTNQTSARKRLTSVPVMHPACNCGLALADGRS